MKKVIYTIVGTLGLLSNSALASGLSALKMNDEKMEVEDGDIMALLINIGNGIAAFVFSALCIYALFKTVWDTWHSVAEYRKGRKESLGEALEPLVTNGALAVFTFAVAVYTMGNFLTWMGS